MGPAWLAMHSTSVVQLLQMLVLASRTGLPTFGHWFRKFCHLDGLYPICKITMKTQLGPIGTVRKHIGEGAAWVTGISIFL